MAVRINKNYFIYITLYYILLFGNINIYSIFSFQTTYLNKKINLEFITYIIILIKIVYRCEDNLSFKTMHQKKLRINYIEYNKYILCDAKVKGHYETYN